MGTLSSELNLHAARIAQDPRIYADANIPIGIVVFMRRRLHWDVLFVLEHDDLRRARDIEHYRLAREPGGTNVALDRRHIHERPFSPPGGGGGIVFCAAAGPRIQMLLTKADRN